jgi:hypothetical protein
MDPFPNVSSQKCVPIDPKYDSARPNCVDSSRNRINRSIAFLNIRWEICNFKFFRNFRHTKTFASVILSLKHSSKGPRLWEQPASSTPPGLTCCARQAVMAQADWNARSPGPGGQLGPIWGWRGPALCLTPLKLSELYNPPWWCSNGADHCNEWPESSRDTATWDLAHTELPAEAT